MKVKIFSIDAERARITATHRRLVACDFAACKPAATAPAASKTVNDFKGFVWEQPRPWMCTSKLGSGPVPMTAVK